jgi:farnesyl diphosphate synthase
MPDLATILPLAVDMIAKPHSFALIQLQTGDKVFVAGSNPTCQETAMKDERDEFRHRLAMRACQVEELLAGLLSPVSGEDEIARPERLVAAMRHGVLNGGKRIRPFLIVESAALFDVPEKPALQVGASLEFIHCYSLIHDDLPAMDDDDLRRGLPTVHVAFDEATAILAGDALQTLAFDVLASPETDLEPNIRSALVLGLARAAGPGGMAGGQAFDLAAEGGELSEADIIRLQTMKTGALIRYACEAGAILAGAGEDDRIRLKRFGEAIGLAFQLADDLLDVTSDLGRMGKATGKDAGRGKGTLVGLHGVEWAREQLAGLVAEANALLTPYGARAEILRQTALFIADRDY